MLEKRNSGRDAEIQNCGVNPAVQVIAVLRIYSYWFLFDKERESYTS